MKQKFKRSFASCLDLPAPICDIFKTTTIIMLFSKLKTADAYYQQKLLTGVTK